MKPFDLEAAKRGEPIQTRKGEMAALIAHVPNAKAGQRVLVLDSTSDVRAYHENGRVLADCSNARDLFMAPKKRTVWVVLYPGCGPRGAALYFNTQEEAEAQVVLSRVIGGKVWPLEIEE